MVFEVAVIGSGPSGATAAFELAQKGVNTVIIEKEILPRYKTCGGGLVYRGLKYLPFNIDSVIEKTFFEVDTFFDAQKLLFTTKRKSPIISMVMRDAFDHLIVQHAEELGVRLLQNHKVESISFGASKQTIHTNNGDIEAKCIVAADGALSPVAKMAGWVETRTLIPALEYEIAVGSKDFERLSNKVRFDIDAVPCGYGWCFPKKKHLSVGVGVLLKKNKQIDLKNYFTSYLKVLGIEEVLESANHGFVIPVTPRTDGFVRKNVFLIGDAAGFADPLVAEGISNAIKSGVLVAEAIGGSGIKGEIAAEMYSSALEKNLLPELRTGVKLAKLFYGQQTIRNLFAKSYGQEFAEAMTDIFMGERSYPEDYKAAINRKIKRVFFTS